MAIEPEQGSAGQGNHLSLSAEAQLNAFREQLGGEKTVTQIIPGFLFRNGKERRTAFTKRFANYIDGLTYSPAPKIDDGLLERHMETYRRGLEARDQLLDRINVVEILEMVRDVWGRGEICREGREALLWCNYVFAREEIKTIHYPGHYSQGSAINGDFYIPSSTGYKITGMWFASSLQAREQIRVDFGNMQFPDPENLPGNETNPYKGYASKGSELREFFVDFYQGHRVTQHIDYNPIPDRIWTRPDNLVIRVTIPYPMKPVRVVGGYRSASNGFTWFDQSDPQQEIMDYLSGKLEVLRIAEQLPLQVEKLELAKIEELRRRGLLKEGAGS